MLPSEHALSQRVLEFLIAHQDWFMLDIPPPPLRKPPHTTTEIDDDIAFVPSSDEEISGGWKLIGRDRPHRKTTVDCSGKSDRFHRSPSVQHLCSDNHGTLTEEDMSAVPESLSEQVGVTRRRTLPSSRRRGETSDSPVSQERSRLLRKQKRASSSQPGHIGKHETPPS